MGHAAGQLAHGFHLLALAQGILGPFALLDLEAQGFVGLGQRDVGAPLVGVGRAQDHRHQGRHDAQ